MSARDEMGTLLLLLLIPILKLHFWRSVQSENFDLQLCGAVVVPVHTPIYRSLSKTLHDVVCVQHTNGGGSIHERGTEREEKSKKLAPHLSQNSLSVTYWLFWRSYTSLDTLRKKENAPGLTFGLTWGFISFATLLMIAQDRSVMIRN